MISCRYMQLLYSAILLPYLIKTNFGVKWWCDVDRGILPAIDLLGDHVLVGVSFQTPVGLNLVAGFSMSKASI